MQSDYSHINDIIYNVSEEVKLIFHTVVSFNTGTKVYSNYNEYKTNNNQKCSTMIKRNLSYYIFFDDRRSKVEKIIIFPENMFDLLERFEYIKRHWIDNDSMCIYAMLDSSLTVVNMDEYVFMKLPLDKAIKLAPGVLKTDMGDIKCIDLYLNSNDPLHITHSTFLGMYYVLSHLDMLNYANTCISFAMVMDTPFNRVDLTGDSKTISQPLQDTSSSSGKRGMSTVNRDNKSAFFD